MTSSSSVIAREDIVGLTTRKHAFSSGRRGVTRAAQPHELEDFGRLKEQIRHTQLRHGKSTPGSRCKETSTTAYFWLDELVGFWANCASTARRTAVPRPHESTYRLCWWVLTKGVLCTHKIQYREREREGDTVCVVLVVTQDTLSKVHTNIRVVGTCARRRRYVRSYIHSRFSSSATWDLEGQRIRNTILHIAKAWIYQAQLRHPGWLHSSRWCRTWA